MSSGENKRECLFCWHRILNFYQQPTLEAQKDASPKDRIAWGIIHGFYAVMGGLAIQIPENLPESKKFQPVDMSETWFLNERGVRHLITQELGRNELPNLSEAEIESKSKANGIAKALVCVQALWFIAQCLTRRKLKSDFSIPQLILTDILCSCATYSH